MLECCHVLLMWYTNSGLKRDYCRSYSKISAFALCCSLVCLGVVLVLI
jgi:hypothetical protein